MAKVICKVIPVEGREKGWVVVINSSRAAVQDYWRRLIECSNRHGVLERQGLCKDGYPYARCIMDSGEVRIYKIARS